MPTVHLCLPLEDGDARLGRDLLRGAELALERAGAADAVRLVAHDERSSPGAAARRAAGDPAAVAFVGPVRSAAVAATQPVLGGSGLLQIAPLATAADLAGPTLVRLAPDDAVLAGTLAAWLQAERVGEVLIVHDPDPLHGVPLGALCVDAALARGLRVRGRPVWTVHEAVEADVRDADAVVYAGVAGAGTVELWHALHDHAPRLWLVGTEGLARPWLARALHPVAAGRTRCFVGQRASAGLIGAEALDLVLRALAAGAGRAAVAAAVRDAARGHWLAREAGRVAIVGGELAWDLSA